MWWGGGNGNIGKPERLAQKIYTSVLYVHNEYGNSISKTSRVVLLKLDDGLLEILQKLGRTVNSKASFRPVYCDPMFVEE